MPVTAGALCHIFWRVPGLRFLAIPSCSSNSITHRDSTLILAHVGQCQTYLFILLTEFDGWLEARHTDPTLAYPSLHDSPVGVQGIGEEVAGNPLVST